MAIGATNEIDRRLAEMYIDKQTVNLDATAESKIQPDDFWRCMSLIAVNNKAFINLKRK